MEAFEQLTREYARERLRYTRSREYKNTYPDDRGTAMRLHMDKYSRKKMAKGLRRQGYKDIMDCQDGSYNYMSAKKNGVVERFLVSIY